MALCEIMLKDYARAAFAKAASMNAYVGTLAKKAKTDMASDKKGQAILEYGILFVAVGLGLVFAVTKLKNVIANKLDEAGNEIQTNVKSKS